MKLSAKGSRFHTYGNIANKEQEKGKKEKKKKDNFKNEGGAWTGEWLMPK